MLSRSKRSKRAGLAAAPLLAAPLVITAVFTAACENRVYTNPMPPQEPRVTPPTTAEPDATATPTAEPDATATPTTVPTASPDAVADLQPIPKNGGGKVEHQPDGSCRYVFPMPKMDCPPTAHCNPGPPRMPIKVKCPDGNGP
jgi:hypothetical protein